MRSFRRCPCGIFIADWSSNPVLQSQTERDQSRGGKGQKKRNKTRSAFRHSPYIEKEGRNKKIPHHSPSKAIESKLYCFIELFLSYSCRGIPTFLGTFSKGCVYNGKQHMRVNDVRVQKTQSSLVRLSFVIGVTLHTMIFIPYVSFGFYTRGKERERKAFIYQSTTINGFRRRLLTWHVKLFSDVVLKPTWQNAAVKMLDFQVRPIDSLYNENALGPN